MQKGTLNLNRGDDQTLGITVSNSDGTPYDLSGVALILQVKDPAYLSNIIFTKSGTSHITPESGISEIQFDSADTINLKDTKYYFDIKLLDTENKITSLVYGNLFLFPQ